MADDLRSLLRYIVTNYVVRDEQRAIELDASPSDGGESIEQDKQDAARREVEWMDEYADAFAQGLARAHQRADLGGTTLTLDDRNPAEDSMADALIRVLVSNNMATSRTEETDANHYTYLLSVNWERLQTVAEQAGIDLAQALARQKAP